MRRRTSRGEATPRTKSSMMREQVAHEENEGEEHAAEQGVAGDFAEDVASEDAHGQFRVEAAALSVSRAIIFRSEGARRSQSQRRS
jgi:hypothetical protein